MKLGYFKTERVCAGLAESDKRLIDARPTQSPDPAHVSPASSQPFPPPCFQPTRPSGSGAKPPYRTHFALKAAAAVEAI
jgi:hypothetical protein